MQLLIHLSVQCFSLNNFSIGWYDATASQLSALLVMWCLLIYDSRTGTGDRAGVSSAATQLNRVKCIYNNLHGWSMHLYMGTENREDHLKTWFGFHKSTILAVFIFSGEGYPTCLAYICKDATIQFLKITFAPLPVFEDHSHRKFKISQSLVLSQIINGTIKNGMYTHKHTYGVSCIPYMYR